MTKSSGQILIGWAVVREYPWDVAALFETRKEAQSKADDLGMNYAVVYGELQENPDSFREYQPDDYVAMIPGSIFQSSPTLVPSERKLMRWRLRATDA